MENFWNYYLNQPSYRDQPLWNFLYLHYNFTPLIEKNLKTYFDGNKKIQRNINDYANANKILNNINNNYKTVK